MPSSDAIPATEIAQYAHAAGFRGEDLVIAVAIALGESGGRPTVLGDTSLTSNKWGPSVGLWQIRSLNNQRGTGGVRDQSRNTDPAANAQAAYSLYTGRGGEFGDWTVYNKGIYKQHLATARAAVNTIGEDIGTLPAPRTTADGQSADPSAPTGQQQQAETATRSNIMALYQNFAGRSPTQAEIDRWMGVALPTATEGIQQSDAARTMSGASALLSLEDEQMQGGPI